MADITLSITGLTSNTIAGNINLSISPKLASQIININTGTTTFGIKFPNKSKIRFDSEMRYFAILDKL